MGSHELTAPAAEALSRMLGAESIVLTTHVNADGDGVGSELALAAFLRSRGVVTWIVNPTPFPEPYAFMVPDRDWILEAGAPGTSQTCLGASLAVVLDTGEVSRIGRVKPMIDHLPAIVIDHHPEGPGAIEGLVVRDTGACATGEMIHDLIDAAGGAWTPEIAAALYVAIMTDTGGFRFSNASPRCFEVAGALVAHGAEPEVLHQRVYGRFPLRRYRLLQESLATLSVHESGSVAWMTVPEEAYGRLEATVEDLEGFVDVPRNIEGVEVALLFRMAKDGHVKVSFRSTGDADVNRIARTFGGGGHVKASGALVSGDLDGVVARVVEAAVDAVSP